MPPGGSYPGARIVVRWKDKHAMPWFGGYRAGCKTGWDIAPQSSTVIQALVDADCRSVRL